VALEDRLKQRLTGAAILVALVVLIVPEMFKGRPAPRPAQLPAASNGAPVRSYTLNLDEHGPTDSAALAAAPSQAAQAPPTAAPSPEAVRPPPAATGSDAAVPASESAPGATPPAQQPVVAVHGPAPAAHAPVAATHTTGVSAHAAAGGAATGKVGWTVQLGSFQQADNARRMAQKLATKGIKCLVVGPDARGYYRVRTPEVADMPSAESLRQRLLQQGFKGVIGTTP
jgi:DedD protein